jgi:hypothetical protein
MPRGAVVGPLETCDYASGLGGRKAAGSRPHLVQCLRGGRKVGPMEQRRCGGCGGMIEDLSTVSYRLPDPKLDVPAPRHGPCRCATPIIYGPPAGFMSIPGMPSSTGRPIVPDTSSRDPKEPG